MENNLMSNYAIENKLENLIPIIYPSLKNKRGIETVLLYKILPCNEIDSVNVNLKMLKSSNMKMHNYLIVICFLVGSFHIHLLFYKMAQLF